MPNEIIEYIKARRNPFTENEIKIILGFFALIIFIAGIATLAAFYSGQFEPKICLTENAFKMLIN